MPEYIPVSQPPKEASITGLILYNDFVGVECGYDQIPDHFFKPLPHPMTIPELVQYLNSLPATTPNQENPPCK